VLHVQGGEHVDAGVEQLLHVLPALGVARARRVGVRELVDQQHGGLRARPRRGRAPRASARGTRPCAAAAARAQRPARPCRAAVVSTIPTTTSSFCSSRSSRATWSMRYVLPTPGAKPKKILSLPARARLVLLQAAEQRVGVGSVVSLVHRSTVRCPQAVRSSSARLSAARSRAARRARRRFALRCGLTSAAHRASGEPRARATRGTWWSAAAGEMCGSRPLPDAVTRSTGTGARARGTRLAQRRHAVATASCSAGLDGPQVGARGGRAVVGERRRSPRDAPRSSAGPRRAGRPARADRPAVRADEAAVGLAGKTPARRP
jgi:hypothetical protein